MESLYILIPIAIIFLAVAIKAFLWAADNKQFDNLEQEAHRILFEENARKRDTASSAHPPKSMEENTGDSTGESTKENSENPAKNDHPA